MHFRLIMWANYSFILKWEVKCMQHWMDDKLLCALGSGRGVSTPRLLEWITYPIFSAPAAHRPLLGPRQWSHVKWEEKEPLLLLHIKKKTTGSISINHKPLQFAFLNLEATSRHFQVHVEIGYIPIPKKKRNPGCLLVSPLQKQSLILKTIW